MKKVLKFIGCIALVLAATMLSSCEQLRHHEASNPEPTVEEYLQTAVNPVMISVDEVVSYQAKLLEEWRIDDTFCDIPQDKLRNIATVCLKQTGTVTKRDIVYEYMANQSVYDNLPPGQPAQEAAENKPDSPMSPTTQITVDNINPGDNVPPPSTITRTEDDTVNGIPLKVTIKEERTYERK